MASVLSFLRAEFSHQRDPARAGERLNDHLCAQARRGCFVRLWLGMFDPLARRCRFVDAGHGHAILGHGEGGAAPISTRGDIPLGIEPGIRFDAQTLALERGGLIVLYRDGVIEQRAPDGAPFGPERLIDTVHGAMTPDDAR